MTAAPPNSEDDHRNEILQNELLSEEEEEDICDEADFTTDYSESDTELRDYKNEQNAKYRKFLSCIGRRTLDATSYGSSSSEETSMSLTICMSQDSALDSDRTLCANSFRYDRQAIEVQHSDPDDQCAVAVAGNVKFDMENRTKMSNYHNDSLIENKNDGLVSTECYESDSEAFYENTMRHKKLKNKPKTLRVPSWVTEVYNEPVPGENISMIFNNDSEYDNQEIRLSTKSKHSLHYKSSASNDLNVATKPSPLPEKNVSNVFANDSRPELQLDLNTGSKCSVRSGEISKNHHLKSSETKANQKDSFHLLHFKHDTNKFPRFKKKADNATEMYYFSKDDYISCEESETKLCKSQPTMEISQHIKNVLQRIEIGSGDAGTCLFPPKHFMTHNSLQPKEGKLNLSAKENNSTVSQLSTPKALPIDEHFLSGAYNMDQPIKQPSKISVASSLNRKGNLLRKNFTFTNEEVRVIERQNKILLQKMMNVKSTLSTVKPKPKIELSSMPSNTNLSSSAINRKTRECQIKAENIILKKKLDLIALRRPKY